MKVIIKGKPKEIAALVVAIQERRAEEQIDEKIASAARKIIEISSSRTHGQYE